MQFRSMTRALADLDSVLTWFKSLNSPRLLPVLEVHSAHLRPVRKMRKVRDFSFKQSSLGL